MRKHLIALLGFLSGVAVYYMKAPEVIQVSHHQDESITVTQAAPVTEQREEKKATVIPFTDPPADISKEKFEELPGLPRGMKFATNVKAIPKENYKKEMGLKLVEKNGFIFFHTEAAIEAAANVVYDERLDTFHPLTATIKLTGIGTQEREEILKEWSEFHYNQDLAIQYIQSTHDGLIQDYEELKKSGFRASLEIVQAVYQSR